MPSFDPIAANIYQMQHWVEPIGKGLEGLIRRGLLLSSDQNVSWNEENLATALTSCADLGHEGQLRSALRAIAAALRDGDPSARLRLQGARTGPARTQMRNDSVAIHVLLEEEEHGGGREAAIAAAQQRYGLSRQTVQGHVAAFLQRLQVKHAGD
jgi:hypothetical protein